MKYIKDYLLRLHRYTKNTNILLEIRKIYLWVILPTDSDFNGIFKELKNGFRCNLLPL